MPVITGKNYEKSGFKIIANGIWTSVRNIYIFFAIGTFQVFGTPAKLLKSQNVTLYNMQMSI